MWRPPYASFLFKAIVVTAMHELFRGALCSLFLVLGRGGLLEGGGRETLGLRMLAGWRDSRMSDV